MPYLAFDLEALERAPNVARAAHITEDAAIAGMARMWKHCWHEETDEVNLVAIEGFFGGDAERVAQALEAFRFLEGRGPGFRVRGAERYLRITKAQSGGGKKRAGNLIPGPHKGPKSEGGRSEGGPGEDPERSRRGPGEEPERSRRTSPGLTPSTEHRDLDLDTTAAATTLAVVAGETPAHKPNNQPPPPPPPPAPGPVPQPADFEPDADGIYAPTAWGFWGWHNKKREGATLYAEAMPPDDLFAWYATAEASVGVEGLATAYRAYLADPEFQTDRGKPFSVFRSPNVYQPRASARPVRRQWR